MVRLSDHTTPEWRKAHPQAVQAADIVADRGGSAREQLDAARSIEGRLTYNAHSGEKQRLKNLERLAKKFLPCRMCGEVEECKHDVEEREKAWCNED
jgi:hypothetical protein